MPYRTANLVKRRVSPFRQNLRTANRRTLCFRDTKRGALLPAKRAAGKGRRLSPPPAAYGEAVCGAPRRCAHYAAREGGRRLEKWGREGQIESRRAPFAHLFSVPTCGSQAFCSRKTPCSPPLEISLTIRKRPEPFGTGRCGYSQQCSQSWWLRSPTMGVGSTPCRL